MAAVSCLTRREWISAAVAHAAAKRPNFLFILADDHAGYVMGCDGNSQAMTPNLDRLARESTRFAAHYCNSPVCTPSRQGILTGRVPHATGVTRLPTSLDPARPTLAKQFASAGYRTAVFGKMHLNRPAQPGLYGFETMVTENELQSAWMRDVKPRPVPPDIAVKGPWKPFQDPARIWLNADKLPFARYEDEMKGTYLARRAIEYLEAHRTQPFALWVSFQEPHSPFDFPVEDRARFDSARFTAPHVGPEDSRQIPLVFRDLSDPDKRGIIAAYYTSVAFLDRNVGRVLDALRRLNLEEDTYVVYSADHGYNLGHHGRFEKHCGYDPALRVPLIMRLPGRIRTGVVRDMTEHVDLTATVVDLLGLEAMPGMHGRSLRPYLEGRKIAGRDHVFSEYLENEEAFVRTSRWKFIFCSGRRERGDGYKTDNPKPGRYRRLYDLKADPGEFHDVATRHPDVVEKMERLMLDRFRATHPESAAEPARVSRAEAIEFYLRPRDVEEKKA
jgi:arylsulfatase A-like enzyme